jgi:class 3 adenylate cyclase
VSDRQHIAVVDDQAEAREMIGDYLALHGFQVSVCDGGASLRQLIQRDPPDLIILDLNMPGEDGLSVIRSLKHTSRIPVIMLTASASAIDRVVGLELGADDYVAKPCELRELLARIRSVLRRMRWLRGGPGDRRLAAIASFDIAGFSRLVQEDEPGTQVAIDSVLEDPVAPSLSRFNGTLFKMLGDGALVEFPSVVDAVDWAVDVQGAMARNRTSGRPGSHLRFRVGIAIGDIIVSNNDRFGEGIALAVRIQELSFPDGVTLSDYVHRLVRGKTTAQFADGGIHAMKNFDEPMQIWHWAPEGVDLPR